MSCPLSNSWALRGYDGICPKCGRKVMVKNTGRLAVHRPPIKRASSVVSETTPNQKENQP